LRLTWGLLQAKSAFFLILLLAEYSKLSLLADLFLKHLQPLDNICHSCAGGGRWVWGGSGSTSLALLQDFDFPYLSIQLRLGGRFRRMLKGKLGWRRDFGYPYWRLTGRLGRAL
jgi:hypothetical protein